MLPSNTLPLPRVAPKPVPEIFTGAPIAADAVDKLVMFGPDPTVKFTELDHTPPCKTWATPEFDPEAAVATICVSLQLTSTP